MSDQDPPAARQVDWQARAKLAGLPQKQLAQILGVAPNTVSLQLRGRWQSGTPQYVKSMIIAWELMSAPARQRLIAEVTGSRIDEGLIDLSSVPEESDRDDTQSALRVREVTMMIVKARRRDIGIDFQKLVEEQFPDTTRDEWREALLDAADFEHGED